MKLPIEPNGLTKKQFDKFYGVRYKGKILSYISPSLIVKQNISLETLKKIKDVHKNVFRIFDLMDTTEDSSKLHDLAEKVEQLDYKLQELWGFDKDKNYHTLWKKCPKCICPKIDNDDFIGTPYRYINRDCPLHSLNNNESEIS